jgi:CelD/BcsL family acetyltransferase involved in cellulose biosynthesis
LSGAEICSSGLASCGQNRVETEALKVHARRLSDFTYGLAAGHAPKLRRQARLFGRVSSKLNYLHDMIIDLNVLRPRCGQPMAKSGHGH